MQKLFQTSAWLMVVLFAVAMVGFIGCGDDDDDAAATPQLTKTAPEDGSDIAANGEVTLSFDIAPDSVTVNGVEFTAAKNVKVDLSALSLSTGSQTLNIEWTGGDGGSATLTLNITAVDNDPPVLDSSEPVADGDEDVEYEGLEEIKLHFNEALDTTASRVISIAPDGGDALPWSVSWEDDGATAVLSAGKGGALTAETTYVITATAPTDKAGNAAGDVTITFTTRAKE